MIRSNDLKHKTLEQIENNLDYLTKRLADFLRERVTTENWIISHEEKSLSRQFLSYINEYKERTNGFQ